MLIEVIDRIYRLLWGVVLFDFSGKSSKLISAIVRSKSDWHYKRLENLTQRRRAWCCMGQYLFGVNAKSKKLCRLQ